MLKRFASPKAAGEEEEQEVGLEEEERGGTQRNIEVLLRLYLE